MQIKIEINFKVEFKKIIADSATEPGVVLYTRSEAASFSGFGSLLLYQDFPLWNLEF